MTNEEQVNMAEGEMTTKEMKNAIEAYERDGAIQFSYRKQTWSITNDPCWDFRNYKFRALTLEQRRQRFESLFGGGRLIRKNGRSVITFKEFIGDIIFKAEDGSEWSIVNIVEWEVVEEPEEHPSHYQTEEEYEKMLDRLEKDVEQKIAEKFPPLPVYAGPQYKETSNQNKAINAILRRLNMVEGEDD
jgi:hypothetical protein